MTASIHVDNIQKPFDDILASSNGNCCVPCHLMAKQDIVCKQLLDETVCTYSVINWQFADE
jgi:hypothetical protein